LWYVILKNGTTKIIGFSPLPFEYEIYAYQPNLAVPGHDQISTDQNIFNIKVKYIS